MKNLFFIYLVLLILAAAGCASTSSKTTNLDRLSDAEIEAYNNNPNNSDKIVCRKETIIGSRLPERVCYMESSLRDRSQKDQESLRKIQTGPISKPDANGGF